MLQLSFSGVYYQRAETPQSFRLALQLLQERLQELEAGTSYGGRRHVIDTNATPFSSTLGLKSSEEKQSRDGLAEASEQKKGEGIASGAKNGRGVQAGGRWFADRWPKITLRSGEIVIPRSVDELKVLVQRQGLRPHKRGDASMLLWQVKERLGLNVESVPRPAA